MKKKVIIAISFIFVLLISTRFISFYWCSHSAPRFYTSEISSYRAMNNGVNYWLEKEMGREHFETGSSRFDGEWLFGTYMMIIIGKCQMALQYPEHQQELLPGIEQAIHLLLSEDVRKFDEEAWGEDAFSFRIKDHGAYLGYANLALSFYRLLINKTTLKGDVKILEMNRQITAFLEKRLEASKIMMLSSYPSEYYSVDNCAIVSSVALFGVAEKKPRKELLKNWLIQFESVCVDSKSGTLIQAFDGEGKVVDNARASGTFLGIYFLSFIDRNLSRKMYLRAKEEYFTTLLGFGAVREYTEGDSGSGDIDSGPVVFGFGLSPVGFMLGSARMFDDEDSFTRLFATCYLGGAPEDSTRWNWRTAGPVGDCILFSMLTCLKGRQWRALCED